MKGVGEPCAGEPHARFDGRGLETERYGVTAPAPDPTNLQQDASTYTVLGVTVVTIGSPPRESFVLHVLAWSHRRQTALG